MMITDEEFSLKEVDQIRVQARSTIHAFAADSLTPKGRGNNESGRCPQARRETDEEYDFVASAWASLRSSSPSSRSACISKFAGWGTPLFLLDRNYRQVGHQGASLPVNARTDLSSCSMSTPVESPR